MNYTLHKLETGFIVVSDEKIKVGDTCISDKNIIDIGKIHNQWTMFKPSTQEHLNILKSCKKVIAQEPNIIFSDLKEEEQRRIGWFDVDFIVKDVCGYDKNVPLPENDNEVNTALDCLKRFQKAQELLSDKRFTLEDLRKAFNAGDDYRYYENGGFRSIPSDVLDEDGYIQSLSQPKSWPVKLEMEDYDFKVKDARNYLPMKPKLTDGKVRILKVL